MAVVASELQTAVKEGTLVGYTIGDSNVTLLNYEYNNQSRLEFPLLANETRQWRCWVNTEDNMIYKSSGTKTGKQKELKPVKSKQEGLEGAIADAHKAWVKYQEKGYTPHKEE